MLIIQTMSLSAECILIIYPIICHWHFVVCDKNQDFVKQVT